MRLRWTILLIVLNVLLLLAVVGQFSRPASQRAFDAAQISFLPVNSAEWDGISVSSVDNNFQASRDRWGRWWLRSPLEWPAKNTKISTFVAFLTSMKVESSFAVDELHRVGQSLQSYGLDKPSATLEISSGERTISYKIGNQTPLGGKLYVLSPSAKEVWVVDKQLYSYITEPVESLKKEGFLPFDAVELEAVELSSSAQKVRFERKSSSADWQVLVGETPWALRPGAWNEWLERLAKVSSQDVIVRATSAAAPTGTPTRISFQTLYNRRTLLVWPETTGGVVAQWEGNKTQMILPKDLVEIVRWTSLLENRPLPLSAQTVTSLDWTTANSKLSLRRLEGGDWVIASADNQIADTQAVDSLIMNLTSLVGKPTIGQTPADNARIVEKVRLQSADQNVELSLLRDGSVIYAYREGVCYWVDAALWPALPQGLDLASKKLWASGVGLPNGFSLIVGDAAARDYAENTPQTNALLALWDVQSPLASAYKGEIPAASPLYKTTFNLPGETLSIDWWALPTGELLGLYKDRYFIASAPWKMFIETLVQL